MLYCTTLLQDYRLTLFFIEPGHGNLLLQNINQVKSHSSMQGVAFRINLGVFLFFDRLNALLWGVEGKGTGAVME